MGGVPSPSVCTVDAGEISNDTIPERTQNSGDEYDEIKVKVTQANPVT